MALALALMAGPAAGHAATCGPTLGDVNGDLTKSVVDAQCGLLAVLWSLGGESGAPPSCLVSLDEADQNCDATVNVVDVQLVIAQVLGVPLTSSLDANADGCPDACETAACGNGVLDFGEACEGQAYCTADCQFETPTFDQNIQPLMESKCGSCHGSVPGFCQGGACIATDFGAYAQAPVSSLCTGMTMAECVLDRIQTGTMPLGVVCPGEGGVEAPHPWCFDDTDQAFLELWVLAGAPEGSAEEECEEPPTGGGAGATGGALDCSIDGLVPVAPESLRLNDWQLDAAIRQLVPIELDFVVPEITAADEGFSTVPGANEILLSHAGELLDLTESIAVQMVDELSSWWPCDPAGASCASNAISTFVERAFRRPPTADELGLYGSLFDAVQTGEDALTPTLALAAVFQAVMLAPEFLYMVELGQPTDDECIVELTPYELATKLSFLFWNEPPDAELLLLAATGALGQPATLKAQAERLLDDPRAEAAVVRFFQEWMHVIDVHNESVGPTITEAWDLEFQFFVHDAVFGGKQIRDLLNSDSGFVNDELANFYGISPNPSTGSEDWVATTMPAERRGGVLTTGQVAAATSLNSSTSIIHRGKFVREQLLCGVLAAPPPGATAMNPVLGPDATVREKMDARMAMSPCGDCHQLMDTIGIGMEDLDENGLFRSVYPNGQPVDSEGEILFAAGITPNFNGVLDLAHTLADSAVFEACAVEQWLRYTLGRSLIAGRDCHVETILTEAAANGGTLRDVLAAVVVSDAFRYRTTEVTP